MVSEARLAVSGLTEEDWVNTDRSFDFVIVGSGAGGAVLAKRLSARPDVRVLLLEARPHSTRSDAEPSPVGNCGVARPIEPQPQRRPVTKGQRCLRPWRIG
ncbi:NAD(P)-binding protein [Stackebrandtia endophytica]|uniref:NAD(P)-binding protein n=1 Tax=Stackebrandtia endophytica TaxID=1496996 RepID=UPI00114F7A67